MAASGKYNKPLITSRGINARIAFQLQQDNGEEFVSAISTLVQSDQEIETYAWLSQAPAMREWVAGRQPKAFKENSLEIRNKLFESSVIIPYDWVLRDKTGQIDMRINSLIGRANSHWAQIMTTLVEGNGTCYDGLSFFNDAHTEGDSGTQDNNLTSAAATNTTPTAGEAEAAILGMTQAILGFKDDQGQPMNSGTRDFLIMAPVSFMAPVAAAVGSSVIVDAAATGGRTNNLITLGSIGGFRYRIAINPRLTAVDKFYLFAANNETAPAIIRQEETAPQISSIAEGSDMEILDRQWFFGVHASRNVGLGFWQSACLHTFT